MISHDVYIVAISTDRSTDRPCALDMCRTARSFTHWSNACVIRRLAFLNLGFIVKCLVPCSLPPSTTSHRRNLVCPRTLKSRDTTESACHESHGTSMVSHGKLLRVDKYTNFSMELKTDLTQLGLCATGNAQKSGN